MKLKTLYLSNFRCYKDPIEINFDNLTMAQIVLDSIKYPHYKLAEPIANYYPQDTDAQPQA